MEAANAVKVDSIIHSGGGRSTAPDFDMEKVATTEKDQVEYNRLVRLAEKTMGKGRVEED